MSEENLTQEVDKPEKVLSADEERASQHGWVPNLIS